jgi:hypothetical protein
MKSVEGKVIVSVDHEKKNSYTFENGLTIRMERDWNNLNRRETQPVNAIVIDGEGLKEGSEILIHPNMTHDSYKIFNHTRLSGNVEGSDVKYYSIPIEQCYAWYDEDWKPLKNFDFALRVFRPYEGTLEGIEPKLVEDMLYVTTGEFAGKIVQTLKACDYEIVFQGKENREQRLIRFRHFPDEDNEREEVIAVREDLTKLLKKRKLLVGLTPTDAKSIV